jgi:hypothetical protein
MLQAGDARVKLERSRQSARECRARKKLRWVNTIDIRIVYRPPPPLPLMYRLCPI